MANRIPPETLLGFYREGLFPMACQEGLRLYSPDPRGIIPIREFHIPHGTRRAWRGIRWELRTDTCFDEVVRACAEREETWIDGTIFRSYLGLHRAGAAHSVEIWCEGNLAGGLYGVRVGAAFFGESMFYRVRDTSKIALCCLVATLRASGFSLLDTQWTTDHLRQFGAREIPRSEYLALLNEAVSHPAAWPSRPLTRDELNSALFAAGGSLEK